MSPVTASYGSRRHIVQTHMLEAFCDTNTGEPAELMTSADEHASMDHIREVVRQYQHQSPARFQLEIKVHQIGSTYPISEQIKTNASITPIDVLFHGNRVEGRINVPVKCRTTLHLHHSKIGSWKRTIISQDQGMETLEHFLGSNFSITEAPLRQDTLWRWWLHNGKSLNWAGLPTELKERIVEYCMHQPHTFAIYSEKLARYKQRYKNNRRIQKPGPFEIVDQLGDWYQLLYVSHQVRAITLRLCMNGGSSLTHSKGLCITVSSHQSFAERINRLGDYYQMIEPDSVPTTSTEEALSKCYRRFPLIYPKLKQYATLRHGIQKISLSMDFLSFMRFFEVKAGGFQQYHKARGLTYHVFERLPKLNEIVIRLPLRPCQGWKDNPYAGGPQLFHEESPCPRRLHRVIYERTAEVLASYSKVAIRNFIDERERQLFLERRSEAINALKFTRTELEDLYSDDGGGIEVPDEREQAVELLSKIKDDTVAGEYPQGLQNDFFPPSCHCDEPCVMSLVLGASYHH